MYGQVYKHLVDAPTMSKVDAHIKASIAAGGMSATVGGSSSSSSAAKSSASSSTAGVLSFF